MKPSPTSFDPRFRTLILFAAGTGLRPGEWQALERRDIDLNASPPSVLVHRRVTQDKNIVNRTRNGTRRRVPLIPQVIAALEAHPKRIDSKLLFPAARGRVIDLHNWREDLLAPGDGLCGLRHRRRKPDRTPYALRHSYAAWALRAGIPTFHVARMMGTSVQMIDKHYGHFTEDASEWHLDRLIALHSKTDGRIADAAGEGQ